ncbi:MAG: flagellar motor switch protein FliN [Betaproteobacteria bacterium TMED156]|nr:MAG: flagellar motor switch protein FliN [Betaproteobacteria bacterium TMED156]
MAENDTEEAVNTDNDENEAVESTDANDEENGLISDSGDDGSKNKINPEVLQGIPVTISVEVGKTSLKIRDLLRLSQGSVVELDRLAGEPLDLLVNNTVVAQGEIVLVNDRYGIRLTRVVPAEERMKTIG